MLDKSSYFTYSNYRTHTPIQKIENNRGTKMMQNGHNGKIQNNEQVAGFKLIRWRRESVSVKLRRLPTVRENTSNQYDEKQNISRSFHFDPVPTDPNHAYSGEVNFLLNGRALIRLNPPYGLLRSIGDSSDNLFDFSESPLAFGKNLNYLMDTVSKKEYGSYALAYDELRAYYAWFRDKVIPGLSFTELGQLTKDEKNKFSSFRLSVITN